MEFHDFHFLRPLWFLALIPAIVLLFALSLGKGRYTPLERLCDPELLSHLWLRRPGETNRTILYLLAMGWLLAIVALAGPVWERQPQPVYRAQMARVIVLDLSPSMNVSDLSPSRLERARFKLADILQRSSEGRTALIVFSGEAHIVTPLTSDTATIETMLPALVTDIIPAVGDSAASGLRMAQALLQQAAAREGDVLLMTDGISDSAAAIEATAALVNAGHRVSILGVATRDGAPILGKNGGFEGMAKIDIPMMQTLARTGGGAFSLLQPDDADLEQVLKQRQDTALPDDLGEEGEVDRWLERGVYLLPLLLLLAALAFRRGWLTAVLVLLVMPPPSQAFEWSDLWFRADQQGLRALNSKQPELAVQKFSSSAWRGAAMYQAGQYAEAANALEQLTDEISRYNRANALARSGELQQAIDAYRAILEKNPDHADAAHNLKIVEDVLKQNEPPPPEDQPENNQGNQDQSQQDPAGGQGQQPPPLPPQQNEQRNIPPEEQQAQPQSQYEPPQSAAQQEQAQQPEPEAVQQEGETEKRANNPEKPLDKASEQWLRQVPDDPAGLLRRKFMLEHLRRKQEQQGS